jgi:hypothetical protein
MRLAGQRGQRGGYFGQAGADIGRRGAALAAVGMPGIGAGDGVPEVPLTHVRMEWLLSALAVCRGSV